jgi:glycosyltransferase involved in cell wall biosynthesis
VKLAIISHTPHFKNSDGLISGWGPTVREINHLTQIFDEIYHLAPYYSGQKDPKSSLSYNEKIRYIPLKPYGGKGLKNKLTIFTTAPFNLKKIKTVIDKVDWIQFRAPTSMGLYVIPFLSMQKSSRVWIKYAGNWAEANPPLSYRIQRWWLSRNIQNSMVTINGKWPRQPEHVLTFTNPCLTESEYINARRLAAAKIFKPPLVLTFVGQLNDAKGVSIILESLKAYNSDQIKEVNLIGDGPDLKRYKNMVTNLNVKVNFIGFLNRYELEEYYKKTHLLLLPSKSEGFPKVVAEAAAYGCVPFVTDISSIGQYINHDVNGYLLKKRNAKELVSHLNDAFRNRNKLSKMSAEVVKMAGKFTFEYYNRQLIEKILNN